VLATAVLINVLSIYRFDDVLGPKFKRDNLPKRKRTRAPS